MSQDGSAISKWGAKKKKSKPVDLSVETSLKVFLRALLLF